MAAASLLSRSLSVALAGLLLVPLAGCGEGEPEPAAEEGIPVPAPQLRPYDGLLDSPVLQEVVEAGVARDGDRLVAFLDHGDPAVRARAAFHLASIGDPGAAPELVPLLVDGERRVRADAAFALGRLEWEGAGEPLVEALEREEDPEVRARILEALGLAGDEGAVGRVVLIGPRGQELAWTDALVRAGVRGVRPPGLVPALLARLPDPDPAVRERAAHHFGRAPDEEAWAGELDRIREALDGYASDDPAAMHLVLALGRQGDRQDAERLLAWLEEAEDWRIRANAARALGTTGWLEGPGVRAALFRTLDDPAEQVGVAAARALTGGFSFPDEVLHGMEERLRGPTETWRVGVPFLEVLIEFGTVEPVLEWTGRVEGENPLAAALGIGALARVPGEDVSGLILEMADHEHSRIRTAAIRALAERWFLEAMTEEEMLAFFGRFLREAEEGPAPSAIYGARALTHTAFQGAGALDELIRVYRARHESGDVQVAAGILTALGEVDEDGAVELLTEALQSPHPRIRREAHRILADHPSGRIPEDLEPPREEALEMDWEILADLGAEPRLRLETERGEVVIRMVPDQAPLTVQTLARQARQGLHDGVLVHRLEPNFVFQAGDFAMGDGTGGPGYRIRTELTRVPFRRGVAGIASSGRDTEGSQYFVTHSPQIHLDAGFTAFGWVESGFEAMDLVLAGDRILRVTVEPGG